MANLPRRPSLGTMLLIACALTHVGTAAASAGGDLGQRESAEEAEAVAPALARGADDDAEQHAAADASVPTAAAGAAANSLDDDEPSATEDGDAAAAEPTPEEVPSGGAAAQPGGAKPADEQPGAAQVDARTTAATSAGAGSSTGAASAGAGASAPSAAAAATAAPQNGPTGQYNGHRQHQVDLGEEAELRRLESGADGELGGSSDTDQPTSGGEARRERRPDDVDVTHLDEDDSLDDAAHEEGSVMHAFIVAVRTRLQHELSGKFPAFERAWLREELTARSWWLRAERASWVHSKLSEEERRAAGLVKVDWNALYVRDVYIWLPDVRWSGMMPVCPQCGNAEEVGNHGFRDNHYARRSAFAQRAIPAQAARCHTP